MSFLWQPFADFVFMQRALLGCLAISLGVAPVGVFLMLRRMSLAGDAIAHSILPGVAVGYLVAGLNLGAMTLGGMAAGLAVGLLTGFVSRATSLREDASMAAFHLLSLSLGVMIISLRGSSVDLLHVLFGSVLALDNNALILLCGITTATLLTLAVVYRPLTLECADPLFLRSVSRWSAPVHMIFLALVVLNLISGFQALGTLMVVGIMILPAAAARFWTRSVGAMCIAAAAVAMMSSVAGLLVSYYFGLPSGPAIVLSAGLAYVVSFLAGPVDSVAARCLPRSHLEA